MNIDIDFDTEDIIVHDTIDADQIEVGDQIIVDGEHIAVSKIEDDPNDDDGIVVSGFSWEDGGNVTHTLPFTYRVDLWSI